MHPHMPMKMIKNIPNLDEKAISCQWTGGVQIDEMEDLQSLIVETPNTNYELTILSGERGDILLQGGTRFRHRTPVRLSGASLAGSLLKLRGIYVGLNLEFEHDGDCIVTSPVRRIGIPQ